jgi:hypothetical protein
MLLDRWPDFLQDITEFMAIADALQPEFDKAAETANSLHNEFSLFTLSDKGAERWEHIMGLSSAPGDTLESRRSRILTKYLSHLPYTYRSLLRYLDQISGGDYKVDLDAANYEIFISVRLMGYNQRTALIAALTNMLPANLVLKLQSKIQQAVENARVIPALYMTHKVYTKTSPIERGND